MQAQTSKHLSNAAGVAHGFFGRAGGVSSGIYASLNCGAGSDDEPQNVIENKRRVAAHLGANELITLAQVHSHRVMVIPAKAGIFAGMSHNTPACAGGTTPSEADALVTSQRGIALGILTADCGSVLFADPVEGVIGAAHAGWKGATGGVLENTVAAMEALGAQRGHIVAALGPTIAQASYEVGEAFAQNLLQIDASFINSDHHFDLPATICARLRRMGLASVQDLAIDTYQNETDYFSYRRSTHLNESDYGRQISAIMLKE